MTVTVWKEDEFGILPAGDAGGDIQVGEAYSRRFHHATLHGRMITVTACPVQGDDTTPEIPNGVIRLQVQTELMVCTDPDDPGSTEVWSDIEYSDLPERFDVDYDSIPDAQASALAYLKQINPALHFNWDGRPPKHTHYSPYGAPYRVDGTLLDCTPEFASSHKVEGSELWADYRYSPRFGEPSDTGLPPEMEQALITAYTERRAEPFEYRIADVVTDEEYTYRVTITNRTAHNGDGPDWQSEDWGIHVDGQWHGIPVNPHPGYEHWSSFCPNCGY